MKELKIRGGAVLFQRLGDLSIHKQGYWDRAPERKGMWAFPWPYYEPFFTHHRYQDKLPKRLKSGRPIPFAPSLPLSREWYFYHEDSQHFGTDTPLPESLVDEEGYLLDELAIKPEYFEAVEAWIKTVGQGKNAVPLKRFWYEGELYAHFHRSRSVGEKGVLDIDQWQLMTAREFAELLKASRGDVFQHRHNGRLNSYSTTHDHFEVFIPPRRGKIS